MTDGIETNAPWWASAVVYQIYPRSFADASGDGIGDLRGIVEHLDHVARLGVDALWLSPVYRSPQDDNGYDISDYRAIDPLFGTLDDFDELVAAAHERGIRIVMDLVVNHTSDEHDWFRASRSSRTDPRRDWYIWRPARPGTTGGRPGAEPNDWESAFYGPAWEWDEATGEYYLHLFSTKQPDLNWENPDLREAVYEMMTWWLDRGVDGFRMDVINYISKDRTALVSVPGIPYPRFGPRFHEYLREMRERVFDGRPGVHLTVGETPAASTAQAVAMTDPARRELDMVFQFEHMDLDIDGSKWNPIGLDLPALKACLSTWQDALAERGWNSLYWNNHDQPRIVSRWGDDGEFRERSAKTLGTVLHLMRGTPYVYQGEELGMTNAPWHAVEDLRDIEVLNYIDREVAAGADRDAVLASTRLHNRDNARTPMQWSAGPHGGFTTAAGGPWIGVNPNHVEINAAAQVDDPNSVFAHYRELIRLRHELEIVRSGRYALLLPAHPRVFAYTRTLGTESLLVVANLSGAPVDVTAEIRESDYPWREAGVLLGVGPTVGAAREDLVLGPWESMVLAPVGVVDAVRAGRSDAAPALR